MRLFVRCGCNFSEAQKAGSVLHTSTKFFVVWKSSREISFANPYSEPESIMLSSTTHVTAAQTVQNTHANLSALCGERSNPRTKVNTKTLRLPDLALMRATLLCIRERNLRVNTSVVATQAYKDENDLPIVIDPGPGP
jgi:hypothetical protein